MLATEASHKATDALVELTPIPSDLTTMFWVIDEVSLPDVDSGYFIHSSSMVASHFRACFAIDGSTGSASAALREPTSGKYMSADTQGRRPAGGRWPV